MRGLIPVLAICLLAAPAQSQPQPDRRRVPDTMAQRLAPCLSCHGNGPGQPGADAPGAGKRRYYPRIAGKPAGYLYNQLQNFRTGRRQTPVMSWMVGPLSDAYLHEIAGWFAGQHLSSPVLDRAGLPPSELERGRRLVTRGDAALRVPACIACHGERLSGALPAVPGLVGLPRDYINAQFGAWRNGTRRADAPDCMAQIAQRLSLLDVSAVSAWLASEALPADPAPAPAPTRPLPLACGSMPERP